MTATRWQQLLFCISWVWPVAVVAHYDASDTGAIRGALFWGIVWLFCGLRLYSKRRWPFAWVSEQSEREVRGKFLNRILIPEHKQPEIVCWCPELPDHISYEHNGTLYRRLPHEGIVISVSMPEFGEEGTWVQVELSNESRKALGLGVAGFGLALLYTDQTTALNCRRLNNYGQECRDILVDVGESNVGIAATFDAAPKARSVEVIIQANRILAAPLLFRIPFEMNSKSSRESRLPGYLEPDPLTTEQDWEHFRKLRNPEKKSLHPLPSPPEQKESKPEKS